MDLVHKFQFDNQQQTQHKSFLRITDAEAELLRSLLPTVEQHVDRIVEEFYAHLLEFAETQTFFIDQETLHRAQRAQREYLLDLFRGTYDSAYFERRLQIGVVHDTIGLPAKWYLGSNAFFFQALVALLARRFRFRTDKLTQCVSALNKVLTLDQCLVMETYIGTMVERIEGLTDQVSNTIQVLAPAAQRAAELANAASEAARGSLQIADRGAATVDEALAEMSALKASAEASVKGAQDLSERIAQIGAVLNLLDEFTTDTNVLALNAAVQAARAGEQSKGFAVIADQIRNLADDSKASLTRVDSLVSLIQEASGATLAASQVGAEKAKDGTQLTTKMGEAFSSLANSAQATAATVQQIAVGVQEQSEEILKLKAMLDRVERDGNAVATNIDPRGGAAR